MNMVIISASHSRRSVLFFGEVQHAILRDEVVAVDCVEKLVSSCLDIERPVECHILYPPHMRRLPVKADLPCSTRQLSKTI
jgi:hypothetical protein